MIFLQQQNVTFPSACLWYLLENLRKTAVLGFRLRAWHSVLMCTHLTSLRMLLLW